MGKIYMCDWQRAETPVVDRKVTILLVRIVLDMGYTYHNKLSGRKRIYTTHTCARGVEERTTSVTIVTHTCA
jgi:hypothetical protein